MDVFFPDHEIYEVNEICFGHEETRVTNVFDHEGDGTLDGGLDAGMLFQAVRGDVCQEDDDR